MQQLTLNLQLSKFLPPEFLITEFAMDLSYLDDYRFNLDDIQLDVEDIAIMENMELHKIMEDQTAKIAEQNAIINKLQSRISALESAVLWCGEACFDEMAENPHSKFKKIN